MIKIAINGFGRIGRLSLRYLLQFDNVRVVAVNDLAPVETLAHLFTFDSVHGVFSGDVKSEEGAMLINGQRINVYEERSPENLPWADLGVDIVLECTGIFRTREKMALHQKAGAKKVLLSAPGDKDVPMFVMGVNDEGLTADLDMVSNASCTTNCLAPMVKVLDDTFGVVKGYMTTVHAYTADQRLLDAPHKDLRRARSAAVSMVPTTTGAAKAMGRILPHLAGKLDGMAVRVPTSNVSFTDLTVVLNKEVTAEEINAVMKTAAEGSMKGIIHFETRPLVSVDLNGHEASCIFDAELTSAQGSLVKVCGWYDNEYGYAARLGDMAIKMGQL
ncbi:MAG: type I glyceraldehyde-3-phosphate dehydrogenase [Flavobacteriales bacterium]|nr:MAG: type I glyceraldehyde-3-phosphate dehydrogenase [Flavobacteriales bacterium]